MAIDETAGIEVAPGGIKSPTVLSLQVSGWLLFICLWLPLCRGCGGTIETPISALKLDSITTLLIWTAFFPIVFSYYRAIEPFSNWLFK